MKRVSFNVAKAIKEAGYPQECDMYYPVPPKYQDIGRKVAQPTYIEVWLWLWRDKKIRFDVEDLWDANLSYPERGCACNTNQLGGICTPEVSDPEEAIEKAIEYLVENDLIK